MNKLEPMVALRKETKISKNEAATVVNLFFDKMAETLAAGDRAEIRGLL